MLVISTDTMSLVRVPGGTRGGMKVRTRAWCSYEIPSPCVTSGSAEGILTFPCYPGHGMLCMHSVFACRPLVQRRCQRLYPNAAEIQDVDHLVCLLHCRKAPSAGGTCFCFCSALHLTRPSTLRPPFAVPCFSRRPCVCTRVLDGVPIQQMVPPCSTPPPRTLGCCSAA